MNDRIKEAFNQIQADEALKDRTREFLAQKTAGYAMPAATRRRPPRILSACAACACLLLMLLGGRWLYFTPTSVISIDINPSLELNVNRFDRIISVTAFNADGRELADSLDLKYRKYEDAVEYLLENRDIAGLLSGNEVLVITVTGTNEVQSAKIFSDLETCTSGHDNVHCYTSSHEDSAAAHASGLSCGKYRAFLQLQALDPDITPEEVQNMTMREIQDLIQRLLQDNPNVTLPDNTQEQEHHGSGGGHEGGHGNGRQNRKGQGHGE